MSAELHWISGPWIGRLAIMPRPRGDDWLDDEIRSWSRAGVDVIVSLLRPDEIVDLSLTHEEPLSRAAGIQFLAFPIEDRSVPASRSAFLEFVTKIAGELAEGKNVAVHCRQGIGRAALVAIGVLILSGVDSDSAIKRVGSARGVAVPETSEQKRWIIDFEKSLLTLLPK